MESFLSCFLSPVPNPPGAVRWTPTFIPSPSTSLHLRRHHHLLRKPLTVCSQTGVHSHFQSTILPSHTTAEQCLTTLIRLGHFSATTPPPPPPGLPHSPLPPSLLVLLGSPLWPAMGSALLLSVLCTLDAWICTWQPPSHLRLLGQASSMAILFPDHSPCFFPSLSQLLRAFLCL